MPIMQIQEPISSLVVPALSRLQDDPQRYRSYFLKATKAVVFVGMPLVAFTAIASREILLILLGERWLGSVPIFQALIPAAFVGTMDMITGWSSFRAVPNGLDAETGGRQLSGRGRRLRLRPARRPLRVATPTAWLIAS